MPKAGDVMPLPPWAHEDARFKEPDGLTVPQWIAWAEATFVDYPQYLHALLSNSLNEGRAVELRLL